MLYELPLVAVQRLRDGDARIVARLGRRREKNRPTSTLAVIV